MADPNANKIQGPDDLTDANPVPVTVLVPASQTPPDTQADSRLLAAILDELRAVRLAITELANAGSLEQTDFLEAAQSLRDFAEGDTETAAEEA